MATPQPLYIHPNTTNFVQTTTSAGNFFLNAGEKLELYCSNGFIDEEWIDDTSDEVDDEMTNGASLIIKCEENDRFEVNGVSGVLLRSLRCKGMPRHTAILTNQTCNGGNLIEIGFSVQSRWLKLMEICFNIVNGATAWTHHYLRPANNGHQSRVPRIRFIQGSFYEGLNVNQLYTFNVQRRTISTILESTELGNNLVTNNSEFFLARGHLAAKSDFVFGSHQLGTFHYINAAPQWQIFNNGNWRTLEENIKKFIDRKNVYTEVFTGTHGVVQFKNINGVWRDIFLSHGHDATGLRLPVPKIYFKVVIVAELKQGIVFVGVNNPYATLAEIKAEYILCPDISDQVKYIPWIRHNITLGYSYACTIHEFTKRVTTLPTIPNAADLKLFL